jgi:hypothetical protein
MSALPEMVGEEVFVGAGNGATTAVAADATDIVPDELDAVTTTRVVSPASPGARTCVVPVAPVIPEQLLPDASQSSH